MQMTSWNVPVTFFLCERCFVVLGRDEVRGQ